MNSETSESITFVSYATKYDLYVGYKNWNELSLDQRRKVAQLEFSPKKENYENIIMSFDLKKTQAEGIWSLIVSVLMLYEKIGLIKNNSDLLQIDYLKILDLFDGTKFFTEIDNLLFNAEASPMTTYTGIELETLAQIGVKTSPLDEALDLPPAEAKKFILSFLETTE